MTIMAHVQSPEAGMRQLVRVERQRWTTPEDTDEIVRTLKGSVSSHATFIFNGTPCTLVPLKGGRAHDVLAL
jgi:hypothetical protein